jgi:hypothetical protein
MWRVLAFEAGFGKRRGDCDSGGLFAGRAPGFQFHLLHGISAGAEEQDGGEIAITADVVPNVNLVSAFGELNGIVSRLRCDHRALPSSVMLALDQSAWRARRVGSRLQARRALR